MESVKYKVKRRDIFDAFLVSVILILCCALFGVWFSRTPSADDSSSSKTKCINNVKRFPKDAYIKSKIHPFTELTREEVQNVVHFLLDHKDLALVSLNEAKINSNFIHTIELQLPPKQSVLKYLDGLDQAPPRRAKVYLFRGNVTPPVVEEYLVGDLPKLTFARLANVTSRKTQIPYNIRPFSRFEFYGIYQYVLTAVDKLANKLLVESYGASVYKCHDKCLRFSMTPVSSAFLRKGERKSWFWFTYDLEFFTLNPLDFQVLVDMTDTDPQKWQLQKVWYASRLYESLPELMRLYEQGNINKTRVTMPSVAQKQLRSSLYLRGTPFPKEDLQKPRQFEPSGPRYTIDGNEIRYMNWKLNYRMSPTVGLQLFNIKYKSERIVYELSLQEIIVLYAGHSPAASMLYFADSAGLFGTRTRGMVPGVDCPHHATFQDVELFTSNESGMQRFENALCIFEDNTQTPLRRHRAYSRTGAFYGGLVDVVLVVRFIISIINYDYIFDFKFHNNGAVCAGVASTGYLASNFYTPEEDRYAARVGETVAAGMHHHLFHFKVDLDVKGVQNQYETWSIEVENKTNEWSPDPNNRHMQTYIKKTVHETELEAAYKHRFEEPMYLLFSSNSSRDRYGNRNSYRIILKGMSKQKLAPYNGFESSMTWARYQMAVTKQRDEEETSSSIFAMWDAGDPVVNFQKYLDNDDSVLNEVS